VTALSAPPSASSTRALNALVARRVEPNTLEQLAASILQHQDSGTYSVCRSRLPDSGMILIGLA
jgi:hypothetical protein